MGYPVVHFEVTGSDGPALSAFYSQMFDWAIDANNPMKYGVVSRDANMSPDGSCIGGGIAQGPDGYPGHVTFYVAVPDVEVSLAQAVALGGSRMMGPEEVMEGLIIGLFTDPEGHVIGLIQAPPVAV